jgi:hypothetical protein
MSRRKRWVVARIVRRARDVKAREAEAMAAAKGEPTGGAS